MLKSMTGFGKAVGTRGDISYNVELRSLNSKQTDVYVRLPNVFKSKELEIRTLLTKELQRGKIEMSISVIGSAGDSVQTINTTLAKHYHQELKNLAGALGERTEDLLPTVLKMPDVLKAAAIELDENEYLALQKSLDECIDHVNAFRKQEGAKLEVVLAQGERPEAVG